MDASSYKVALDKAIADWTDLTRQEGEIAVRKAQLKRTIKALRALCSDVPDISSMSLSDAIRLVISSNADGLSVLEIRGKLKEMGYDLSKFKTPLASIHTAVNRMVETEELVHLPDEEDENKVEAGKNLKTPAIPDGPPIKTDTSHLLALLNAAKKEMEKE